MASGLLLAALALGTPAASFIEDDFGRAQATAKASGRLLFVDVWAPW
jgi:hypothetical protein